MNYNLIIFLLNSCSNLLAGFPDSSLLVPISLQDSYHLSPPIWNPLWLPISYCWQMKSKHGGMWGLHHSFPQPILPFSPYTPNCPALTTYNFLKVPHTFQLYSFAHIALALPKPGRWALGRNRSQNYRNSSGDPHMTRCAALLAKLSQGWNKVPWDTLVGAGVEGQCWALRLGIWEDH